MGRSGSPLEGQDGPGGQQEEALEILIFNLTILHLWGRFLTRFPEDRAIVYTDDGYIKVKLSVVLQVLVLS